MTDDLKGISLNGVPLSEQDFFEVSSFTKEVFVSANKIKKTIYRKTTIKYESTDTKPGEVKSIYTKEKS